MFKTLITATRRTALPLAALVAMTAFGCQTKTSAPQPGTTDPAEQAKSEPAKPAADDKACATYGEKFCEATGAQSPSCQAIKMVSGLMSPKACQAGLEDIAFTKEQVANLGKKCTELMEKLCKDLGEETQTCGMVRKMTPSIPGEQCGQMMAEYDKVLAELKAQEEMNKPLSAEKQAKLLANNPPAFGPEGAAVTIVEFSDFECPYCTMAATATNQVKEKYGDKVRFIFRQFPLPFHQNAHLAHQASLAAHEQGKFWEFHDKVFANQKAMSRDDLERYATELKLDMKKFKAALDEGKYKKAVDDDLALGQEVTVQGTPTMFINGERVSNPTDFNVIAAMIEGKLNPAPAAKPADAPAPN